MSQENAGAMESLYPFLYSGRTDLSAVMDQVRASTVAKAQEIMELRQTVAVRDGARMADCARQAAARFAAAGACSPSATAAAPPTPPSSPPCS